MVLIIRALSQTYIHAKAMIVDDRIAIIGSANINERSQRGDRDSELACVVRDTDMIDSTMGGLPYQVGRFAHTMRIRLMREHLGVNVDELEAEEGKEELDAREASEMKHRDEEWDPDHEQRHGATEGVKGGRTSRFIRSVIGSGAEYVGATASGVAEAGMMGMEKTGGKIKSTLVPSGSDHTDKPEGLDTSQETEADRIAAGDAGAPGFASSVVPTVEEKVMAEARSGQADADKSEIRADNKRQPATVERQRGVAVQKPLQARQQEEEKDGNFGERFLARKASTKAPTSDDPEHDEEGSATTQHNTSTDDTRKLVSQDGSGDVATDAPLDAEPSDVANADQGYHALDRPDQEGSSSKAGAGSSANGGAGHRKTEKSEGNERAVNRNDISDTIKKNLRDRGPYTVPLTAPRVDPYGFADPLVDSFYKDVWLAAAARNTQIYRKVFRCMPDDLVQTWKQYREFQVSLYSSVQLRSRSLPAPTQSWSERHQKVRIRHPPLGRAELTSLRPPCRSQRLLARRAEVTRNRLNRRRARRPARRRTTHTLTTIWTGTPSPRRRVPARTPMRPRRRRRSCTTTRSMRSTASYRRTSRTTLRRLTKASNGRATTGTSSRAARDLTPPTRQKVRMARLSTARRAAAGAAAPSLADPATTTSATCRRSRLTRQQARSRTVTTVRTTRKVSPRRSVGRWKLCSRR